MILVIKIFNEINKKDCVIKAHQNALNILIKKVIIISDYTDIKINNSKISLLHNRGSEVETLQYIIKSFPNETIIWSDSHTLFDSILSNFKNLPISQSNILYTKNVIIFNTNAKFVKSDSLIGSLIGNRIDISSQIEKGYNKPRKELPNITTKNIVRKIPNESIKISKIETIIVSVDYNDILIITLENNIKYLDSITVVTSSSDIVCQEICDKFGVNCFITDRMYENGAKFNKGKAINDGIRSLKNPDWVLLLDADILLTSSIDKDTLDKNILYTSSRYICDYESYKKWSNGEIEIDDIGEFEKDKGYGFFHLYNINNRNVHHRVFGILFSEKSNNASGSDISFRNNFKSSKSIEQDIIHIGQTGVNWSGRKSEKVITDLYVDLYNNNIFDINEYFDKIYCINLERRKDRWSSASKQFLKFKINVEKWPAVDGDKLSDELFQTFNPKNITGEEASKKGIVENKNSIGCLLSHLEVIKDARSKGYKKILIFEDDVILSKNFLKEVKQIEKLDWKLLYLGASQFKWNGIEPKNGYYLCDDTLGTFAYAIDSIIYDNLINLLEKKDKSIDNLLSEYQKKNIGDCYTIFPNIVISDVSKSDIRESKEIEKYASIVKWNLNLFENNKYIKFNNLINSGDIEMVSQSKINKIDKSILFIIYLNDTGGAEYVSYQHIKMCRDLGYKPIVISAGKGMFFDKIKCLDVDLYFSKLNDLPKYRVAEILDFITDKIDIIYNCNYFGISEYIHEIKEKKSLKYYTIAHSDIEWVINEIYRHDKITDRYIVIHDKIRDELNKKGVCNTRIITIPNYVDFEKIEKINNEFNNLELKNKIGISENDFVIGMTTRISPDKNILDSIKILSKLNSRSKILIVGDAPNHIESITYKNQVLEEIKKYGLQDRVIITGHVENDEVSKYLSLFDISLNNSPSEGLPISLLEQMSVGIHCVYPSHGEIPLVLENCGTIIEMKQRKSFHVSSGDDYIFSRFKEFEIDRFVNEINKIINGENVISSNKIIERIKYQRNSEKIKYYLDFLFGDYQDGVSFIIRARNEVLNIEDCIKSISDIADEIIYVDHLSTDGTYEKALELSKIYDNLKVFRYDREIPKPGPNYQKNIINVGNSISQYYNFCISKATKKTILKWDADFVANRNNLKELINEFSLKIRSDKFSIWFTGETLFIKDDKKYINKKSYYDEYRGFSLINGVKWSDAIRCEYVDREYVDSSISSRFEKPCFYEIKRIDIDEFEHREGLIDKRDQQDYEIIQSLINNQIVSNLVEINNLNEKTVLTYGTFDTFHFGHLEILRRAKELGQRLIVGLSTDEFNKEKGKISKYKFEDRKKWLESIKYVDLIITEDNWSQKVKDILKFNVDIFVIGDDWSGKFDDLPCEVVYLPRTKNISTTEIKKII